MEEIILYSQLTAQFLVLRNGWKAKDFNSQLINNCLMKKLLNMLFKIIK